MSYFIKLLILFITAFFPVITSAQICQTNSVFSSTPTSRFTISNDGTVNDTKTGLTWKKCSEGQVGTDCSTGNASSYSWQGALKQVKNINDNGGFAGYKDWRLPNIKELNSIIEDQCNPSINLTVFPQTQNVYWSSSPNAYNSGSSWSVGFNDGLSGFNNKNSNYFIRLVRG